MLIRTRHPKPSPAVFRRVYVAGAASGLTSAILPKVYAHAVDGHGPAAMKRIEDALDDDM
ncbi:hypothetical protein ACFV9G_17925 [Nocardioides sp. NPDC059952]|uniref:hypothetical protein n=1 Tax=Nocardioides sp. NPDC059952 TaxID=3347014 RepID=UPI00365B5004